MAFLFTKATPGPADTVSADWGARLHRRGYNRDSQCLAAAALFSNLPHDLLGNANVSVQIAMGILEENLYFIINCSGNP